MSLIKCSECGKEISDKASSCPSCGNPIHPQSVEGDENKKATESEPLPHTIILNQKIKIPWAARFYGLTLLFIILLIITFFFSLSKNGTVAFCVAGGFIFWIALWLLLDYACISYVISEHMITINSGILIKRSKSIPFAGVQNINNSRDPISMIFGISKINIWTASPSQIQINNGNSENAPSGLLLLRDDDAVWLKDYILKNK